MGISLRWLDGTETLLEIPAFFVGWQRISFIIESKTLYDCKRLHAAKKECVGSQRIFWVLEEIFWCLRTTYSSTLCGVDRLCMLHTDLNIDANLEDCRQGFHVSQIQILVFCIVASNCVCHAQTLSVFSIGHHCTSLAARNWCWGSLGSLENTSFFLALAFQKPGQHALKALNGSLGCLKQISGISEESPRRL